MGRWHRFRALYLPSVFPYLVIGWVTAAGGAWNASIVSEYVVFRGETLRTFGLGG
jgi:NitT/TauT family transport system permease protein